MSVSMKPAPTPAYGGVVKVGANASAQSTGKRIRENPHVPGIFRDEDILVPLKCDITMAGARFVDTFCWGLYKSGITPDEFAARTAADLVSPSKHVCVCAWKREK
jgi:hypothetical protein